MKVPKGVTVIRRHCLKPNDCQAVGVGHCPSCHMTRRHNERGPTKRSQVLALLGRKPGLSTSEIAQRLKFDKNCVNQILNHLKRAGKIKPMGWALASARIVDE
jgi:hypothetical protein